MIRVEIIFAVDSDILQQKVNKFLADMHNYNEAYKLISLSFTAPSYNEHFAYIVYRRPSLEEFSKELK